ncbi:MAG: YbaK/EbsC family protein [Clostridia bacterium]|nr:YbaK/EbsC family protein [Clostridia bacterium]
MAIEKAREYLKKYGMENEIMEFDVSSATVEKAAAAIGCSEREIAKTLSFLIGERAILIVAAGDAKIDNAKYKAEFHTKAKMIPFDLVEPMVGHAVGGVCPFGIHDGVTVYLDVSLRDLKTVYPACGSANSAIRLTPAQLERITCHEKWIDVCRSIA